MAHGLHLSDWRDNHCPGQPEGPVSQRKGRHRVHAGGDAGDGETQAGKVHFRGGFYVPSLGRASDAKITIPSPSMVHYRAGAPRSIRRFTQTSKSSGAIWSRSTPTRSRRWERWCTLFATRRHQPCLSQRPVAASLCHRDRRRRRASTRHLHPAHQRGALKKARGDARLHTHVPRKLQVSGWRRAATSTSPKRSSTS